MTKLKTYIENNGINQTWMAKKIGIAPNSLSRIATGKAIPSLQVAYRIEKITKGEVKMVDLLPKDVT